MHRMRQARFVAMLAAVVALIIPVSQQAAADDPPIFLDWPSLLPGLLDEYQPSSANDCVAGRPHCVDATIREMERRFRSLGPACDHNAVFALAYLRTTQTYRWARDQSGYFADTPWVNHEDAVFAKYYFAAYDNWAAGARGDVPQAWLIAFDAAAARQVNGSGDLLLGMNAHVNRDLPITLAAVGMATPDGQSRKPDHDKVDQFLNTVLQPLLEELAARFDSSIIHIETPYGVGYTGLFQTLAVWREQAWRNGELLANATTPEARAVALQEIETYAATQALTIKTANSYVPPLTNSTARDAYCAAHNGDPPPTSYAFGTASAY
jgi:Family of unknown function (DUF5995)